MADISITAANVLTGSNSARETGIAGATVTAGQVVYKEAATGQFKLADCNSATAEARVPYGVALHGSLNGQPLTVQTAGTITPGATLVAGVVYYLSGTAGGIRPVADNTTGDFPATVGMAISTTQMTLSFVASPVAL